MAETIPRDEALKITVFTSCWNQAEFLPQAIESVLRQTHQDFEYLIYDDGSTDNTKEVMQEYDDPRIKTFYLDKQDNVGCVINKSFKEMSGDFWVWCPADDVLSPELLAVKMEESLRIGHEGVIYSNWENIGGEKVILPHLTPSEFDDAMRMGCPIGMTGIWIPKWVIGTVGEFPEHLPVSEDFYWVLTAVSKGIDFYHIPRVLYSKRRHKNSSTFRNARIIPGTVREIRKDCESWPRSPR